MNRREVLIACAQASLLCMTRQARASRLSPSVVFLNPGEAVERGTGKHWQFVSRFMTIAAKTLNLQLEILYAERDHLLMQRQAEELARRAEAPDYIVIVNEKMAAQQMLKTLASSPAKVMLVHNDLTREQRREIGNERQQIQNWIGTVTANATGGGYRLMDYLCQQLGASDPRVIGITGDPNTPVSLERTAGVNASLSTMPHARTCQLVFGDWSFADGDQKARVLLARYPDANLIWAANDTMTLGALNAVEARHASVLVGGVGALPEALTHVADGGLAAMVGGDYFIGAFAMVLLHDYHCGRDFALSGGASQKLDYLSVVHRGNVVAYQQSVFGNADSLNFSQYSKYLYPSPGAYDFTLKHLLKPSTKVS